MCPIRQKIKLNLEVLRDNKLNFAEIFKIRIVQNNQKYLVTKCSMTKWHQIYFNENI